MYQVMVFIYHIFYIHIQMRFSARVRSDISISMYPGVVNGKKKKKQAVIFHCNHYRKKLNNDLCKIHKNRRINVLRTSFVLVIVKSHLRAAD